MGPTFRIRNIGTISIILQLFNAVASSATAQKYSRVILQTSNIPEFSLVQTQDNGTWESKGFSVRNISVLLSEHYTVSPPPSISKENLAINLSSNASKVFCSNKTASLTIVIKDFMHPVMFLNFSYYIEKTYPNVLESTSETLFEKNPNKIKNSSTKIENSTSSTSTKVDSVEIEEINTTKNPITNSNSLEESLRNESIPSTPVQVVPAPLVQQMSKNRRKRFVSNNLQQVNTSRLTLLTPGSSPKKTSSPSLSVNSTTTPLNPLTLVQAVEVIKNAAAIVAAAGITPTETKRSGNGITITGHTLITKNSKTNESNEITKGSSAEINDRSAVDESNARENTNDSKTGSVKNQKRNWKNKITKPKNERTDNEDYETEKAEDSSSSSSSSEEDALGEGETKRKTKISYKTWRASLEKRNRPPGLYVTVNDDIVFDNWDGIWNKPHILGKWSGAKESKDGNQKWNQTYIFINWDDVSTRHDVKITFEWEPIDEHSHIILSDIVVSTIAIESNCSANNHTKTEGPKVSNEESEKGKLVLSTPSSSIMLGDQPVSDPKATENNITSFFLLQGNSDGKATWNVIKFEKKENHYEKLSLDKMPTDNKASTKEMEFFKKVIQDFVKVNSEKIEVVEEKTNEQSAKHPSEIHDLKTHPDKSNSDTPLTEQNNSLSQSQLPEASTDNQPNFTGKIIEPLMNPQSFEKSSSLSASKLGFLPKNDTMLPAKSISNSSIVASTETVISSTSKPPTFFSKSENMNASEVMSKNKQNSTPKLLKSPIKKKTDGQIALLMTVLTGSIACAILVLTIKQRINISNKGRNATR